MNVQIQSVKFDADARLVAFIERKMEKLERFAERATSATVTLRVDNDPDAGNKTAAINLALPGHELVAEHRAKSFEEAFDLALESLKRQLERVKVAHA